MDNNALKRTPAVERDPNIRNKDFDEVLDSDWGEEVFIPEELVKSDGEYKLVLFR